MEKGNLFSTALPWLFMIHDDTAIHGRVCFPLQKSQAPPHPSTRIWEQQVVSCKGMGTTTPWNLGCFREERAEMWSSLPAFVPNLATPPSRTHGPDLFKFANPSFQVTGLSKATGELCSGEGLSFLQTGQVRGESVIEIPQSGTTISYLGLRFTKLPLADVLWSDSASTFPLSYSCLGKAQVIWIHRSLSHKVIS